MDKEFQNQILEIIEDAGEALLDFFDQPIQIQKKDDGSLLLRQILHLTKSSA